MKYYWISYRSQASPTSAIFDQAGVILNEHPFEAEVRRRIVLSNWKEITKEEYDLFVKLNKNE